MKELKVEPLDEVGRLIGRLDSLKTGEEAAARLSELGSPAVEHLRRFVLEGTPRKVFQPRFWAVEALARLGARDVLLEYLFLTREIPDPEDRFGEEAVESAAARLLAGWPSQEMFALLMKLSERRLLNGLIDALAEYRRPEAIPYFERALEDDFYRSAAEEAFRKLGKASCDALAFSAVSRRPSAVEESPSSLERRRSALRLLNEIGISRKQWRILRCLIQEADEEIMVNASKLGMSIASKDLVVIARRLIQMLSSAPWHLQEDIENILVALDGEVVREIEAEIARRLQQPEKARAVDERLRALLRLRHRFEKG